ncbi:JAB domain-containing protein [Oscillatoria amoena NRMC-F 0135]|jgi:DNA repair protein RadC|nr:JAB domain-containing protein [Oscillatoria amoena NRMC-F 0135]
MQVRLTKEQKVKIANADDVYAVMRTILMRENKLARQKEHFWVVGLSHSNVILYIELVALGTINEVMVKPVEVFNFAVVKKATKIILVHNHPSGELKASEQDIRITQRLKAGADALEIRILDHFIISETGYISMYP